MSSELDLRGLDRAHEPDPEFVEQLRQRLVAATTDVTDAGARTDEVEIAFDPPHEAGRALRRRIAAPIAAAILIVAVVGGVLWSQSDGADRRVFVGGPDASTAPTRATNGWVAYESGDIGAGDIRLARSDGESRRLEVAGSDTADDACPAWSPDGTRLLFGRLTPSSDATRRDAELVIVPVSEDGVAGSPTVIALDGFDVTGGFDAHPCGIWAPDGRWVAFAGTGAVWVVDTQTGAIRRLPDLRPSDLEWRPGTDELAIAGDLGTNRADEYVSAPVSVYSVATGELHELGSVRAAEITWSPHGSTLAYLGGENDPSEIRLVDADGSKERLLVADAGERLHGIGPMWSPTGDRIVYQRRFGSSGERHEVVLVRVADGNQTVIPPPETEGLNGPVRWFPYFVVWSPDGTTLLYSAWSEGAPASSASTSGVILVPTDAPSDVTVLPDANGTSETYSHRWAATQMWGRQPK